MFERIDPNVSVLSRWCKAPPSSRAFRWMIPCGRARRHLRHRRGATGTPRLEIGIDGYYKKATNLIDDGQFGQAFVLTAFNYAKGENVGVELSAKYKRGSLQAYANLAWARQLATTRSSTNSCSIILRR